MALITVLRWFPSAELLVKTNAALVETDSTSSAVSLWWCHVFNITWMRCQTHLSIELFSLGAKEYKTFYYSMHLKKIIIHFIAWSTITAAKNSTKITCIIFYSKMLLEFFNQWTSATAGCEYWVGFTQIQTYNNCSTNRFIPIPDNKSIVHRPKGTCLDPSQPSHIVGLCWVTLCSHEASWCV